MAEALSFIYMNSTARLPAESVLPRAPATVAKPKRYSPFQPAKSPATDEPHPFISPFPTHFTGAMLAIFGSPIIAGMHLANDPSVFFWAGAWGYLTALIPVLLIVAHAMHAQLGKPGLIPVVFSTVVPAVFTLFLGKYHEVRIHGLAGELMSRDCTTWSEKLEMQTAWNAAEKLYDGCINQTVTQHGLTMEDGYREFRIQECAEYAPAATDDPHAEYRARWEYLMYLEAETLCSGWCAEGRPLWTFDKGARDPCAAAAGAALEAKVKPMVYRMMAFSLLILSLSAVGIGAAGQIIRKRGDDWA